MQLKIEDLTIEQKLGMVFCARRFAEADDVEFTAEMIRKRALGCLQMPSYSPKVCEKLKEVLKDADYPVLVFNDTEMGFPTSKIPKIPLMALAACNNKEYYRVFAKRIARDARAECLNGTWGPVLDVLRADGPCRVYRSFSDDPRVVAEAAEVMAEVYKKSGYLSTGKHYPGGHDYVFDTHMAEGLSSLSKEELIEFDLAPYMYLYKKGLLPCVMSGHTVYPKIDPDRPASLSKPVIDVIRELGYDGLMFTDSFAMMGILQKYGEENVYGMAIEAGNDVVLPNFRHSSRECFEMLVKNFEDGAFSEERLNEAVRRVLTAQAFVAKEPEEPVEFTAEDEALFDQISRDCLTLVTDEGVDIVLSNPESTDRLFIIVTENCYDVTKENPEIEVAHWYNPKVLAEKIRAEFPGAGIEFIPEFSGQKDNDRVLTAASGYKEVVFISFCTTTSYLGTDSLTKRTEMVMNCLVASGKVSAIVHFGNPLALQPIAHVPRRLFGYMSSASLPYAIDALKGNITPKGKLPIRVDLP